MQNHAVSPVPGSGAQVCRSGPGPRCATLDPSKPLLGERERERERGKGGRSWHIRRLSRKDSNVKDNGEAR